MTDLSTTTTADRPAPLASPPPARRTSLRRSSEHSTSPLFSFLAGFAGGSASTILLYPLDLIKVRMQVDERRKSFLGNVATSQTSKATVAVDGTTLTAADKPRTICTTVRGVIRYEGYLGLYRGLAPAIIGSAASWGGFFILYEQIKSQMLLRKQTGASNISPAASIVESQDLTKDLHVDEEMNINPNANAATIKNTASNGFRDMDGNHAAETRQKVRLGPIEHFSASCLAGACMVAVTNPIWLIKTRLQLQNSNLQQQISQPQNSTATQQLKPPYRGIFHAARTIVQEEGVLALYKGSVPALMLVSHGGIQFVTYEFLKGHYANVMNTDKSRASWRAKSNGRNKGTIGDRLRNSLGYLVMGAVSKL